MNFAKITNGERACMSKSYLRKDGKGNDQNLGPGKFGAIW